MKKFVKTRKFEELNIGYSLDEGVTSDNDTYLVAYGERSAWCNILFFSLSQSLTKRPHPGIRLKHKPKPT